jgi:ABC-type multidrug transport system ATPase subunit
VLLEGRSIDRRSERARRLIGYAGHEPGLYRDLSIIENLSLFGNLYGVGRARVEEMIDALALGDYASVPAGTISAGISRRAAVARALLHEPRILLLDEPYANLDDEASGRLSDAVRAWRGPDRVALIATHGAKKVKAFADGGVILRDGHVQVAGLYRRSEPTPAGEAAGAES